MDYQLPPRDPWEIATLIVEVLFLFILPVVVSIYLMSWLVGRS